MKVIWFALLVAAVGAAVYFKPWEAASKREAVVSDPTDKFMQECIGAVPPDHPNPRNMCICVWKKGVSKMMHIAQPRGRSAWADCTTESR